MQFSEMSLNPALQKCLTKIGFEKPTSIQEQTIPLGLNGQDVIGCSQTGTGKTAAFLIPIIHHLIENKNAKALIMTPTRELAEQIHKVAYSLTGPETGIRTAILIGGVAFGPQFKMLRALPRLFVATPGRLIDHVENAPSLLSQVKYVVLDEADRMLDMGFLPQIQQVIKTLPVERQSFLFSATLSKDIKNLSSSLLKNPTLIQTTPQDIASPQIDQKMIEVDHALKNDTMVELLTGLEGTALVFVKTQMRTEKVNKHLKTMGFKSETIHGGKSQAKRKEALDLFRKRQVNVLVATDLAARGLDVDHVELVINLDLPMDAEDYVHRIGRTGRNGRYGVAASLVAPSDRRMWTSIQKMLRGEKYENQSFRGGGGGGGRRQDSRPPRRFGGRSSGGGGFAGGGRDRDRRPKRFGERSEAGPQRERSFERPERGERSFDRPKREGSFERPQRSFERPERGERSFDRPKREGSFERPQRSERPTSTERESFFAKEETQPKSSAPKSSQSRGENRGGFQADRGGISRSGRRGFNQGRTKPQKRSGSFQKDYND